MCYNELVTRDKEQARYTVVDRYATTASELRPKSTAINPRYWVWDTVEHTIVDEFTTKRPATMAVRDLNREAR